MDDERAATLGELRSTRRWLAVAAVWAVAATALAVLALLEAGRDDDERRVAGELGEVQQSLNERIDELEARIEELPTSEDLSNLDGRLSDLEARTDESATNVERLDGRLDDLEARVDELDQAPDDGTETTP